MIEMGTKIKKEYTLTIGSNSKKIKIEDLDKAAYEIEQFANKSVLMRVHLFEKDYEVKIK